MIRFEVILRSIRDEPFDQRLNMAYLPGAPREDDHLRVIYKERELDTIVIYVEWANQEDPIIYVRPNTGDGRLPR